MPRTHRTVALVALLVLSSLSGPVGTAAAADSIEHCSEIDEFLWVLSLGRLNDQCDSSELSDAITQIQHNENTQTWGDLYDALSTQNINRKTVLNTLASYTQDSRTTAFVKAENATIQALQTDATKTQVKQQARQAVTNYYATSQQMRLIHSWESTAIALHTMHERAENESLALQDFTEPRFANNSAHTYDNTPGQWWIAETALNTTTVYLANGTAVETYTLIVTLDTSQTTTNGPVPNETVAITVHTQQALATDVAAYGYTMNVTGLVVNPPPNAGLEPVPLWQGRYATRWNETTAVADMVADNAAKYAAGLYEAEQNGTINPKEYVSPYVMAQEYATQYNSTGYWSYAISSLAASGLATPALNNTGVMTVAYQGTLHEGLIMSDSAPNGTWRTGVDYHPANISGRQWLVTTSGERIVLDDTFRIKMMTNAQGERIQHTQTVQYVYKSSNITEYKQLQERILQLQRQIESRTPKTTGGGWSGVSGQSAVVLVLAGAAAVLILNNT